MTWARTAQVARGEVALAAGTICLGLPGLGATTYGTEMAWSTGLGLTFLGASRHPLLVLALSLTVVVMQAATSAPPIPADIALVVAAYLVGARTRDARRSTGALLAACLVLFLLVWWSVRSDPGPAIVLVRLAMVCAPVAGAWWLGRRQQLRHEAVADLVRELEGAARAREAAERLMIARELHDVVAHQVSVMVVQAGGAARIVDLDPVRAQQAMKAVARTGQDALHEMRDLLGVLRGDSGEATVVPTLADVPALVNRLASAGCRVQLTLPPSDPLLPSASRVAYRVLQEGLTNALRHAGTGAQVLVTVQSHEGEVQLSVVDNGSCGPTLSDESAGYGLAGLRERVRLVGGTLMAQQLPQGGFRLSAVLPVVVRR